MRGSILMVGGALLVCGLIGPDDRAGILAQHTDPALSNPHSDLIFRATGATSCRDCHRSGKEGQFSALLQDNELVRGLRAKAPGIHGPGRFADCLRCHAGGDKGVEKYRKQ
ncbi:MAG TPA: hypothetical protein VJ805_08050 [Nitrospiraceae bacterium]|nr:hypothetical protein [Nitrospiraceae bacterium]